MITANSDLVQKVCAVSYTWQYMYGMFINPHVSWQCAVIYNWDIIHSIGDFGQSYIHL